MATPHSLVSWRVAVFVCKFEHVDAYGYVIASETQVTRRGEWGVPGCFDMASLAFLSHLPANILERRAANPTARHAVVPCRSTAR